MEYANHVPRYKNPLNCNFLQRKVFNNLPQNLFESCYFLLCIFAFDLKTFHNFLYGSALCEASWILFQINPNADPGLYDWNTWDIVQAERD